MVTRIGRNHTGEITDSYRKVSYPLLVPLALEIMLHPFTDLCLYHRLHRVVTHPRFPLGALPGVTGLPPRSGLGAIATLTFGLRGGSSGQLGELAQWAQVEQIFPDWRVMEPGVVAVSPLGMVRWLGQFHGVGKRRSPLQFPLDCAVPPLRPGEIPLCQDLCLSLPGFLSYSCDQSDRLVEMLQEQQDSDRLLGEMAASAIAAIFTALLYRLSRSLYHLVRHPSPRQYWQQSYTLGAALYRWQAALPLYGPRGSHPAHFWSLRALQVLLTHIRDSLPCG